MFFVVSFNQLFNKRHCDEQRACDLITSVFNNIKLTIISLGIVFIDRDISLYCSDDLHNILT